MVVSPTISDDQNEALEIFKDLGDIEGVRRPQEFHYFLPGSRGQQEKQGKKNGKIMTD